MAGPALGVAPAYPLGVPVPYLFAGANCWGSVLTRPSVESCG
jgi:hypothetical protein